MITTVVSFVLALGILITFHEMGHYAVARLCGVKVLRFCLGFGKPIFSRRVGKDQTEWALAAIPLGGYVKMLDEREGEVAKHELHRAFNRQPVMKRIAIVAAGPIANFLLAIFLYWFLFVSGIPGIKPYIAEPAKGSPAAIAGFKTGDLVRKVNGEEIGSWQDLRWVLINNGVKHTQAVFEVKRSDGEIVFQTLDLSAFQIADSETDAAESMGLSPYNPPIKAELDRIVEGSVAEAVGLQKNDLMVAVNDEKIETWQQFARIIRANPDTRLRLSVKRHEKIIDVSIRPSAVTVGEKTVGEIGVSVTVDESQFASLRTIVSYPIGKAFVNAVSKTWEMSIFSLKMIGKMLIGEVSWKNLSGPITIADYTGQAIKLGWLPFVTLLALISINLGVLNLLPIPLLDGGHLMYYVAELVKGSPVSERTMEIGSRIGFALLFVLMAFAFYNDVNRHLIS